MPGEFVLGLDHVTVTTPEELEEQVIDWYADTLRLDRVDKPEGTQAGGAWFRVGSHEVHVSRDPHNPPKVAHFALIVSDFAATVERLRDKGCHLEQAAEIPGRRRCFTRDPAGNAIEIIELEA